MPPNIASARLADLPKEAREEYWATLALRCCPGLGARSLAKLLRYFNSAKEAFNSSAKWQQAGIPKRCIETFNSESWLSAAKDEWINAEKSGAIILLWTDTAFPERLRQIIDPPALLYCAGDLSLLSAPCIAVVGSRAPSSAGLRMAAALGNGISGCGICVVSGMAQGIDRGAHSAALAQPGRSIGVLGTGINFEYPRSNKDIFERMRTCGLLVSEFAPNTAPVGSNFPIRNRIISGLSLGVVVVEAAERSGSLITARLALEQNRSVFAVPASPLETHSAGCKNLIRSGAIPVFETEDILRDLAEELRAFTIDLPAGSPTFPNYSGTEKPPLATSGPSLRLPIPNLETPPVQERPLNVEQEKAALGLTSDSASEKIMACLAAEGILHGDQLLELTGLASGQLSAALIGLEMLGRIRLLPGSRYEVAQ